MAYITNHMLEGASPTLLFIQKKIAAVAGVESCEIGEYGGLEVVLEGGVDKPLREAVLDVGRRAMIPVRVAYRMHNGKVFEESKNGRPAIEWVGDYYTPIKVPGFAGEPVEAPPEEVAAEPKGALKLRRVRSATRGRPVVAWRHGDQELRQGTTIKFNKESCLQWTMGRTLTVKPGAVARVSELSPRRPIAFIVFGEYEQIELPVHMLGHAYDVDAKKHESVDEGKAKSKSKLSPGFMKLMNTVGMGGASDWDDNQGQCNPDDKRLVTGEGEEEEEMLLPEPKLKKSSSRTLITDKNFKK